MIGIGVFIRNNFISPAKSIASAYESRVLAAGGIVEGKSCLVLRIKDLL